MGMGVGAREGGELRRNAAEDKRLVILIDPLPARALLEAIAQDGIAGGQHGLHLPPPQLLLPPGSQRLNPIEVRKAAVEVDLGAAVDEDAVLGPQPPDAVAAPTIVIVETRALRLPQEKIAGASRKLRAADTGLEPASPGELPDLG